MTNPILEAIAEIAQKERKNAVKDGDYGWAVFSALVEAWAQNVDRKGGGQNPG